MPDTWEPVKVRDERQVDREVARRLVSRGQLVEFIEGMCSLELGVSATEVLEEFGVADWVARVALVDLLEDAHAGRVRLSPAA